MHQLGLGEEVEVNGEGVKWSDDSEGGKELAVGRNKKNQVDRVVGTESGRQVWRGGVPCIVHSGERRGVAETGQGAGDEGWVDGLNGLLKFNYPFGDEG